MRLLGPGLALLVFLADRLTKTWFVQHPVERYDLMPDWLWLQLDINHDMALSLPLFPVFYYGLVATIMLVLCWQGVVTWQTKRNAEFTIICVLLSAAISNLLDRLLYGGVVDFITVSLGSIFNLADVAIVAAVGGWAIVLWKHDRKKTHARTETI